MSRAGKMTLAPPAYMTVKSWALQPVTWKSGTEIKVRSAAPPSSGSCKERSMFSQLVRKAACVVIAPFGKPVVPLV